MQAELLKLNTVRELLLNNTAIQSHLSAASGMWIVNHTLYVVADDQLELGVFSLLDTEPGVTLSIIPGVLPTESKQRKAVKPDFESLTGLPPSASYPYGALLALGSGSTELRQRGMLWPFDQQQRLTEQPQIFSLQALYQPLEKVVAELNIEGVVVQGDCLKLWHRANNQQRDNAVIEYCLSDLYLLLDAQQQDSLSIQPYHIERYNLGEVAGVPLTFTDACALPSGDCLFTAVAENTDNSYEDGECVGAAIGLLDQQRRLRWIKTVYPLYKIEGISAQQVDDGLLKVYLVSDADNPSVPAKLLDLYFRYPL